MTNDSKVMEILGLEEKIREDLFCWTLSSKGTSRRDAALEAARFHYGKMRLLIDEVGNCLNSSFRAMHVLYGMRTKAKASIVEAEETEKKKTPIVPSIYPM